MCKIGQQEQRFALKSQKGKEKLVFEPREGEIMETEIPESFLASIKKRPASAQKRPAAQIKEEEAGEHEDEEEECPEEEEEEEEEEEAGCEEAEEEQEQEECEEGEGASQETNEDARSEKDKEGGPKQATEEKVEESKAIQEQLPKAKKGAKKRAKKPMKRCSQKRKEKAVDKAKKKAGQEKVQKKEGEEKTQSLESKKRKTSDLEVDHYNPDVMGLMLCRAKTGNLRAYCLAKLADGTKKHLFTISAHESQSYERLVKSIIAEAEKESMRFQQLKAWAAAKKVQALSC